MIRVLKTLYSRNPITNKRENGDFYKKIETTCNCSQQNKSVKQDTNNRQTIDIANAKEVMNNVNLLKVDNMEEKRDERVYVLSTGANRELNNSINAISNKNTNQATYYSSDDESDMEEWDGEIGTTVAEIHNANDNSNRYDFAEYNQEPQDKLIRTELNNYDQIDYGQESYDSFSEVSNNIETNLEYDRDYDVVECNKFKELRGDERTDKLLSIIKIDHLKGEVYQDIEDILHEYREIFYIEGDRLTYAKLATHDIETSTNIPINRRQYRFPEATKMQINEQIDEMLKLGIIRPSKSPWNAPVLCVPKKLDAEGIKRYRLVVDFRALNLITKPFIYPIPLINEILDNIGESRYFTTIDLKSGFYQIPINPKDAAKTAFSTLKGHFEFTRMPMGLRNSPSTFQKLMNTMLYSIQPVKAFVYLDDIVVFGNTIEEHNENLCKILNALRDSSLKIEPAKCSILHEQIKYLGHIISKDGIKPTGENVEAIKNMKTPKTVRDVRSFLGTVNFYGKFIPNMADKRKPLNDLLKKNVRFNWNNECEKSFQDLKTSLISEPLLVRPNYNDTFVLTTDASDYAIGAVLTNEKTTDRPIAYASRGLVGAEKKYFTIEKELLAIVWAVEYFKHYIFNQHFIIYTDHRPLIALWRLKETSPTLTKLRLKIQGIDCEIRYKQGKENVVADFLSRLHHENDNNDNNEPINMVAVTTRRQARNNQPINLNDVAMQNHSMDGLNNIDASCDKEEENNKTLSFDDFKEANIEFNSIKFTKKIIP